MRAKAAGFSFTVYPGVFNPSSYKSSEVFAGYIKQMKDLKGRYVLDMGCGSGIVSLAASSLGARCLAVDVNPESVRCTGENLKLNHLKEQAAVMQSDLFQNIPRDERFDIIFFNPPYYEKEPKNYFETAFNAGEGHRVIREFFNDAGKFLAKDGFICCIVSSDLGISKFVQILEHNGFKHETVTQFYKFFETFFIVNSFLT